MAGYRVLQPHEKGAAAEPMDKPEVRVVTLAGNLGAGKSTVLARLALALAAYPLPEPVKGNRYLEDFGRDPVVWGLQTQLSFLLDRLECWRNVPASERVVIQERSPQEDFHVFAPLLDEMGMPERDRQLYDRAYVALTDLIPAPGVVIYVTAPPEQLLERVRRRNWRFERWVDLSAIRRMSALYDDWISSLDESQVLVFRNTQSKTRLDEEIAKLAARVQQVWLSSP